VIGFIVRRLLWTIPTIFVVMLCTFWLLQGMGGSPFIQKTGGLPGPVQARLSEYYHLQDPWYVQFFHYVKHTATFDFGPSLFVSDLSVDQVIKESFLVSAALVGLAAVWAIPLGIGLGLLSGLRRNTALDYAITSATTSLMVVPVFLLAGIASTYFVYRWHLVPLGWEGWRAKIVPSLVLALAPAGYIARLVRAAVVETLTQDYVRTARAKGLRPPRIVLVHVLRNSVGPFLAAGAPLFGLLITGAFFVEISFGIPGVAQLFYLAAKTRDYPLVMGLTVALAMLVIAANLIADVTAAFLDPRLLEAQT
jgi:ABC-type dipeptide/oligopeptide/nickel transport system permease component